MKKLGIPTAIAGGLGIISLGLACRGGLALVVDPVSAKLHCEERLAGFLGVQSFGPAAQFAEIASELWIVLIPVALIGAVVMLARRRRSPGRPLDERPTS